MARTVPVHSGYTILNGTTTGSSAYKADTWVEYKVIEQSIENNQSHVIAYFYTALADGYSSGTYDNQNGRDCSYFTVDGVHGTEYTGQPYDYRISTPMLLGSFDGWITHNSDGTKSAAIMGAYTITSSYISGGNISTSITLPAIDRGLMRAHDSGAWGTALVYTRYSGTWRQALAYGNSSGSWKLGG